MEKRRPGRTYSLMRADLNRDRFTRPRPYKAPKPLEWYATEESLRRPAYAAHSLARISEHLLRLASTGRRAKPKEAYVRVANFFYAAQEAVGYALIQGAKRGRKFPPPEAMRAKLRPLVAELAELLPLVMPKKSVDKSPSSGLS